LPEGGNVEAVAQVSETPVKIAFLSFENNPFWFPIRDGAKAANEYLKNFNAQVDYIVMSNEIASDKIIASIETAVVQEYDGICVFSLDGCEGAIDKAVDAGIPVITYCTEGSAPSERFLYYGQDLYEAGQLAGQLLAEKIGGSGKVGLITGSFGVSSHELRRNGFKDYLQENAPDIEIIGEYENNDKGEVAYSLTKDMLTAHSDLAAIYVTAGGPFGAGQAIQEAGLTGEVPIFAFDHIDENLAYVKSGEIAAAINQDPFGQGFDSCVIMYNYIMTGDNPYGDFYPTKLDVVTPDNIGEMYPDFEG
jgi:ABC-type sugar transport system substrate-binding protein